jgi:ribosomal protein S18 acetylase RimI-like enzyme
VPNIREATDLDLPAIRVLFFDAVATGDTLTPVPNATAADFTAYWYPPKARVFVAILEDRVVGSYMLRPNQPGLGDHVANAGYLVDPAFRGRGIASAMCAHSIETARAMGFRAMQFNFVVSTNVTAVRIWERYGFTVVGRLPKVFRHAEQGEVDALVMHRFI